MQAAEFLIPKQKMRLFFSREMDYSESKPLDTNNWGSTREEANLLPHHVAVSPELTSEFITSFYYLTLKYD